MDYDQNEALELLAEALEDICSVLFWHQGIDNNEITRIRNKVHIAKTFIPQQHVRSAGETNV